MQHRASCDGRRIDPRACGTLIEKFDNARIRLKRPAGARRAAAADIDPYRSRVGIHEAVLAVSIMASIFTSIGAVVTMVILVRYLIGS